MEETVRILRELSLLLARYGYEERSEFVAQLAGDNDSESFWQTVAGLEFWGGSGAIWEVAPFKFTHADVDTSAEDYRRFQVLMIELGEILQSRGIAELAAPNAQLFRKELQEGG
jgi:hypothetical protein